jgi:hypothetical protein
LFLENGTWKSGPTMAKSKRDHTLNIVGDTIGKSVKMTLPLSTGLAGEIGTLDGDGPNMQTLEMQMQQIQYCCKGLNSYALMINLHLQYILVLVVDCCLLFLNLISPFCEYYISHPSFCPTCPTSLFFPHLHFLLNPS